MDVDGVQEIDALTSAHLTAEAGGWGMPPRLAARVVRQTLERLGAALRGLDRDAYPRVGDSAWAAVDGRVMRLLAGS